VAKKKRGGNRDGLKIRGVGNGKRRRGGEQNKEDKESQGKIQTARAASKHEGIHSMEEESISL
jgi:hypothetical protein